MDLSEYNDINFVCDIEKLPFKNESIYAFVSKSVFEHLANPLEVEKYFAAQLKKVKDVILFLSCTLFVYPRLITIDTYHMDKRIYSRIRKS